MIKSKHRRIGSSKQRSWDFTPYKRATIRYKEGKAGSVRVYTQEEIDKLNGITTRG
jgi:hypothetical protein